MTTGPTAIHEWLFHNGTCSISTSLRQHFGTFLELKSGLNSFRIAVPAQLMKRTRFSWLIELGTSKEENSFGFRFADGPTSGRV